MWYNCSTIYDKVIYFLFFFLSSFLYQNTKLVDSKEIENLQQGSGCCQNNMQITRTDRAKHKTKDKTNNGLNFAFYVKSFRS